MDQEFAGVTVEHGDLGTVFHGEDSRAIPEPGGPLLPQDDVVLEDLLQLGHGEELRLRQGHAHPAHLLHELLEGGVRRGEDGPGPLVVGLLVSLPGEVLGHPRVFLDLDVGALLQELVQKASGVESLGKRGQHWRGPDARLEVLVLHEGDELVAHPVHRHARLGLGPRNDVHGLLVLVPDLELAVVPELEPEAARVEGGGEPVPVEGPQRELLVGLDLGPVGAPLDGLGGHRHGVPAEPVRVHGALALVHHGPPGEVDGLLAHVLDDDGLLLAGTRLGENLHELNFRGGLRCDKARHARGEEQGLARRHRQGAVLGGFR
mmetsp:Transcript_8150/g.29483  ORF Transcript_8150/g.29483 Transcript_8150/m.29483 type:complete len:319 (+) Transcript_8150:448-1404(+)